MLIVQQQFLSIFATVSRSEKFHARSHAALFLATVKSSHLKPSVTHELSGTASQVIRKRSYANKTPMRYLFNANRQLRRNGKRQQMYLRESRRWGGVNSRGLVVDVRQTVSCAVRHCHRTSETTSAVKLTGLVDEASKKLPS